MEKQSVNFDTSLFEGYTGLFVKLVIAIIIIYGLVLIINILRDKFINKKEDYKQADYLDLFTILNRLLYISGYGFIIGNLLQVLFDKMSDNKSPFKNLGNITNLGGEWGYLTFGIIIIFIGLSFKSIKKTILKERANEVIKNSDS